MAGLIRPRSFPIRKITETAQRIGRIFQARRYPEQGGFTSGSRWTGSGEFKVELPTKIRTGESAAKGRE
jgi:hypothetical protein